MTSSSPSASAESASRARGADGSAALDRFGGKRLLVVMPALNEAATIAAVIARVPRQIPGISNVEIAVVDDGSTDSTAELARAAGAHVLRHRSNRGVGAALQTGLSYALHRRVDLAVNIDSDGQFAPEDIVNVIAPVLDETADMATASRFKDPKLIPQMPRVKRIGNWGMSAIVSRLCGQRFSDVSCGFRAYSRETLLRLVLTGRFTYTQETFLVLSLTGFHIVEIPVAVRGVREHGSSRVASNLFKYAYNTLGIILGSLRSYRPALLFQTGAALLTLLALGFGAFFFWHRIASGRFWPHTWAGFVAAYLFALALLVFAMGQIAEMVRRLRVVQDEQLYLLRRYLVGENTRVSRPDPE
jgi:glycosyltransferase involved in cell wall biosynthesis